MFYTSYHSERESPLFTLSSTGRPPPDTHTAHHSPTTTHTAQRREQAEHASVALPALPSFPSFPSFPSLPLARLVAAEHAHAQQRGRPQHRQRARERGNAAWSEDTSSPHVTHGNA
jgi:hypothetical protein